MNTIIDKTTWKRGAIWRFALRYHLGRDDVVKLLRDRGGLGARAADELAHHWFTTDVFRNRQTPVRVDLYNEDASEPYARGIDLKTVCGDDLGTYRQALKDLQRRRTCRVGGGAAPFIVMVAA